MLIDAHCHPQRCATTEADINSWKNHILLAASTTPRDFLELKELSRQYPWIHPSLGLHPWEVEETDCSIALRSIRNHLCDRRYALGEIGLDASPKYKHSLPLQRNLLRSFFTIAHEENLPIILHSVRAHHEILALLKSFPKQRILLHAFTGSIELQQQYQRYECYFGLSVFRFKKQALELPLHRIFLETDGFASSSIFHIAYEELAQIKNDTRHKIERQIEENYHSLFENVERRESPKE